MWYLYIFYIFKTVYIIFYCRELLNRPHPLLHLVCNIWFCKQQKNSFHISWVGLKWMQKNKYYHIIIGCIITSLVLIAPIAYVYTYYSTESLTHQSVNYVHMYLHKNSYKLF